MQLSPPWNSVPRSHSPKALPNSEVCHLTSARALTLSGLSLLCSLETLSRQWAGAIPGPVALLSGITVPCCVLPNDRKCLSSSRASLVSGWTVNLFHDSIMARIRNLPFIVEGFLKAERWPHAWLQPLVPSNLPWLSFCSINK